MHIVYFTKFYSLHIHKINIKQIYIYRWDDSKIHTEALRYYIHFHQLQGMEEDALGEQTSMLSELTVLREMSRLLL